MARYSMRPLPTCEARPPWPGPPGSRRPRRDGQEEAGFLGIKFRGQDLNLRPPGYEPGELPLLHPGINPYLTAGAAAALPLPPLWPRNVRVGANSPSLCPTMSSVTKTFMNWRPLWTKKV